MIKLSDVKIMAQYRIRVATSASTRCGWRWARSSESFEISVSHACAGPGSDCRAAKLFEQPGPGDWRLRCDNRREFPLAFALAVEAPGIRHRYIRPRRPQQNGKVSAAIAATTSRHSFTAFETAGAALRTSEATYNYKLFSLALHRFPSEATGPGEARRPYRSKYRLTRDRQHD